MNKTLKIFALILVTISTSYTPQAHARNIPMVVGGSVLAGYLGVYSIYKTISFVNKSDEELTQLIEEEYQRRLQEDPTRTIAVEPSQMVPLVKKAVLAAMIVINVPLTILGGYMIKKGLSD